MDLMSRSLRITDSSSFSNSTPIFPSCALDSETENPNSSPSIIVFAENDVEPLGSIRRFSILKSIATSTAQFCPFFNSRQSAIAAEVEKATTRQAIANRVFIIGQQVVIWPGWWGLIQIFPVWFSERPGGSCARDLIVWKCLRNQDWIGGAGAGRRAFCFGAPILCHSFGTIGSSFWHVSTRSLSGFRAKTESRGAGRRPHPAT